MRSSFKPIFLISLFLMRILHRIVRLFPHRDDGGILILALKRIGDTAFLIPALVQFSRYNSSKNITVLCNEANSVILRKYLSGVELMILPRHDMIKRIPLPTWKFLKKARAKKPREILDVTSDYTSIPFLFANRAKVILGANKSDYSFLYSDFIPIRTVPYLQDIYFDVFNAYDNQISSKYHTQANPRTSIRTIGINPHAGWKAKEWSLSRYVQLTEILQKEYEVRWIIEPNSISHEYLKELSLLGVEVHETLSIESLMAAIAEIDLFIGNDSGPIHLASLEGVPTFAIFGPTNPDYIYRFGSHQSYIIKSLPCSPVSSQYCHLDAGTKCPSNECIATLSVEDVMHSIRKFIKDLCLRNDESKH